MLTLCRLNTHHRDGYVQMMDEFTQSGEGYPWNDADTARADFDTFLKDLADEEAGRNLPAGCPRQITYVLVDSDDVVGEFRFRPWIEPPYEQYISHIAYNVHPMARRRGYATQGLYLVLEEARRLGLKGVHLTVEDPENTGSIRAITANNGHLIGTSIHDGQPVQCYSINISTTEA